MFSSSESKRKRECSAVHQSNPAAPHPSKVQTYTYIYDYLVPNSGFEFKEDYMHDRHGLLYGRERRELEGVARDGMCDILMR